MARDINEMRVAVMFANRWEDHCGRGNSNGKERRNLRNLSAQSSVATAQKPVCLGGTSKGRIKEAGQGRSEGQILQA